MSGNLLSDWLEAFEGDRARERGALARLLHDETGGSLTAAGIELTLLRMDLPAEYAERLDALERSLDHAFSAVRAASLLAAPDVASRLSLADALSRMAEAAGRRFAGTLALSIDTEYRPDAETAQGLFRIAECLTAYLSGEAKATSVEVELDAGPVLTIRANRGVTRAEAARALGPTLARYWAAKTNLRFLFGNPDAGSTMCVIRR